MQEKNKAILWHCSAGKDRTGFATIIVLELLEVSRNVILEDYLYSNKCVEDKKLRTLDLIKKHNIDIDVNNSEKISVFHKTLDYLSTVREEYISSLYDKVKELYGDFDGLINKGLKITDKHRYQLKDLYLQ
ncbi:MAG: tyrosine-protein phosphatase [Candidatus Riflebacteria bacterium]|nr:tyrosine-protein phosphatase [Candidatus Riflebacteria bacterium]